MLSSGCLPHGWQWLHPVPLESPWGGRCWEWEVRWGEAPRADEASPPTHGVASPARQSCRHKCFWGSRLPGSPVHHREKCATSSPHTKNCSASKPRPALGVCSLGSPGPITSGLGHCIASLHCTASQPYAAWLRCVRFRITLAVWTLRRVCMLHPHCPVVLCLSSAVVLPFVCLRLFCAV